MTEQRLEYKTFATRWLIPSDGPEVERKSFTTRWIIDEPPTPAQRLAALEKKLYYHLARNETLDLLASTKSAPITIMSFPCG